MPSLLPALLPLAVFTVLPMMLVAGGYYVVFRARKYIDYVEGQIARFIKTDINQANY